MAISRFSIPLNNTLQQYVPLPLDTIFQAAQATQNRYDTGVANDEAMQTGIASTEALAPAYKEFVNTTLNNYRKDSGELLSKYNNRFDDPEFQREQRSMLNRYKNDPRWSLIKSENEKIKADLAIANKLRAEGKKVFNPIPRFQGYNPDGSLKEYTPGVREVTAWDDLGKDFEKSWQSIETDKFGNKTNLNNLNRTAKVWEKDADELGPLTSDMYAVLEQNGLSREEAKKSIKSEIRSQLNNFGVRSDKDHFYEEWDNRMRLAEIEARAKSSNQDQLGNLGPYFIPTAQVNPDNPRGIVSEKSLAADLEIPLHGKMNIPLNRPFSGVLTGDVTEIARHRFGDETNRTKASNIKLKNGVFQGVEVPYIIKSVEGGSSKYADKVGQILSKDTGAYTSIGSDGSSYSTDIQRDNKGAYVYLDKDNKVKGYLQPQAFSVYTDADARDTRYYKKLGYDETLTYLGPQAGKFSNEGYGEDIFSKLPTKDKIAALNVIRKRGYNVDNLTQDQINDLIYTFRDEAYYNSKKAPLYAKPSTTSSFQEDYYGK